MSGQALACERRGRAWLAAVLLFVSFSVIFTAFRSSCYNGDMVWQSCTAEGIIKITYKPDHLLYGPMVRGIYLAWKAVGLPGRGHVALQTANALFGAATVALMFVLVRRVTGHLYVALFTAVFFGLTPHVWHHATDVETYASTRAFQLAAIYLTVLLAEGGALARRYRLALGTALFHALATHIQYLHVMLVPAVLAAALLPGEGVSLRDRLKVAGLYLVTVGVLVWGPFLYVAFAVENVSSVAELKKWLLSPNYGWPAFARMGWVETPLKVGAHFVNWATPFALPTNEAKRVLLGQIALPDYIRGNWWRLLVVSALGAIQLAVLARVVFSWRKMRAEWKRPLQVVLAIIIFYGGFHLYWGGSFMGLGMAGYVLLLAMGAVYAVRTRRESKFSAVLTVVVPLVLALSSIGAFAFGYLPEHDPDNNPHLKETLDVAARLGRSDLLIGPGGCLVSDYFAYFAPDVRCLWLTVQLGSRGTRDPLTELLNKADRAIESTLASGDRVFVQRIYSESEDEVTRPWNEFLFAGIHRKDVVKHFSSYRHEEAFVSHGHAYWHILGPSQAPEKN